MKISFERPGKKADKQTLNKNSFNKKQRQFKKISLITHQQFSLFGMGLGDDLTKAFR